MDYKPEDIEDYLNDEMDESARKAFEAQLSSNQALQQELVLQQTLRAGIRDKGNQLLKEKLKRFHQEEINNSSDSDSAKVIPLARRPIVRIMAAAVTLLVVALAYYLFQAPGTDTDLFAANYEPYAISLVQRGTAQEQLTTADGLYREGQFSEAQALLESLEAELGDAPKVSMALAICYIETDQLEKAQNKLNELYDNPLYQDKVQWYLALIALKNKQPAIARAELEKLSQDQNSNYQDRAKNLLRKL